MNYDDFSFYMYFIVFFIEYYEIGLFDYWFIFSMIGPMKALHLLKFNVITEFNVSTYQLRPT